MTSTRELSGEEIALLRRAGSWGLLRSLDGRLVCMTGKMSMTRHQLQALVESAGGRFTNVMSAQVQLLVVADSGSTSTKTKEATRLGIPILTEIGFVDRLTPTPEELDLNEVGKVELW